MSINIAEYDGGKQKIEISNDREFLRTMKRAWKGTDKTLWSIRVVDSDRVPAAIQRLIDETQR